MPILKLDHVKKTYGVLNEKIALNDISLQIYEGEVYTLLGPNGSGKTTLMKVIMRILKSDSGLIELFGSNTITPKLKKRFSYLPETPHLPPFLNAISFLEMTGSLYDISSEQLKHEIPELLKRVGLWDDKKLLVENFSKGMAKRLAIAQALLADVDFYLFDEPIDGLDPLGVEVFRDIILELKQRGKTVLLNTHILTEVEKYADKVGFIKEGKVFHQQEMSEILSVGTLESYYLKVMKEI